MDKESDGKDADEQVLEDAVRLIKKRVRGSRKKNHYWTRSLQYLLTSRQVETFAAPISNRTLPMLTPEERVAEAQTRLAIQNLASYNCIIGLAEKMGQSMTIIRHALISGRFHDEQRERYTAELFDDYTPSAREDDDESSGGIRVNVSTRDGVSTESVLQRLKEDGDFLPIFQEYVKYEETITSYAQKMHDLQHEEAQRAGG